jgi:hypothetical protein
LRNWTFLALVALLPAPASLPAQVVAVPPGTRVRVLQHPCADEPRACMPLVGRALRPAGDSLLVEDVQGVVRTVDLQSGARIERSAGYRRHTLLGLGLGTLAGVGTGAVLASGCTQGGRGEDDGLCNIHYVVAIPVGAAVGTLVGALIRTERWETVPGSGAALSVWPGAGRTTVVVTSRF